MNMNDALKAECNLRIYVRNEAWTIFENILIQSLYYTYFIPFPICYQRFEPSAECFQKRTIKNKGTKIYAGVNLPQDVLYGWYNDRSTSSLLCFKFSPSALLLQAWFSSKFIPGQVVRNIHGAKLVSEKAAINIFCCPCHSVPCTFSASNIYPSILKTCRKHAWLNIFWLGIELIIYIFFNSECFYCSKFIL